MKIVVVCLGNICRSPIAEGIFQQLIDKHQLPWMVASAGTNGYHTGEPPHASSTKVCQQNGIDISHQVSIKFTAQHFDDYDLILVMAKDVYNDVLNLNPNKEQLQKVAYFLDSLYPGQQAGVTDPWYGPDSGYLPVFTQIEKACIAWLHRLK
jgi:protein-tyrosine phosphatase